MASSHVINKSVTVGGKTVSASKTYTGDSNTTMSIDVPSATEVEVLLALTVAQIQSIFISSDRDVTLETNNTTTPDETINLIADVPYHWAEETPATEYDTNLFETDLTSIFINNQSGSAAVVKIEALFDGTP